MIIHIQYTFNQLCSFREKILNGPTLNNALQWWPSVHDLEFVFETRKDHLFCKGQSNDISVQF